MKQVLLLFIFLSLGNFLYPQSVKETVNNCLKEIENDNFENLRKEYSSLYIQMIKEIEPNYINAVNNIQSLNYTHAFSNLYDLISEGYMLDEIKSDDNFQKLHNLKEWTKFTAYIDSITENYDNVLRKELNKIQYEDQGIRILLLNIGKIQGVDNQIVLKLRKEMKQIDSINAVRVQQIINEFGWLGKSKIGSEANQTLFLTIQHVDDLTVQEKYLPMLEQAVKDNNAEPWQFAFLTDRILMNQGKFQIYGTQVIISKNPKESYVVPLQDPYKVDTLRKQIGLEPLKEYLQDEGIEWDVEKYIENLPQILELYKRRNNQNN